VSFVSVPVGFVVAMMVAAAAGVLVFEMRPMSVCVMSAARPLMLVLTPVSASVFVLVAKDADPRLEFHFRTAHGFALQSTFQIVTIQYSTSFQ